MKKVTLYIFFILFSIFLIPSILKKDLNIQETNAESVNDEKYDYGIYSNINLFHIASQKVENIDLDSYLYGVVASEMPATFEEEALKAQAVVARTYTIYQMKNGGKHEEFDICDNSMCCQAWISKEDRYSRWEKGKEDEYWGKIVNAVDSTKGNIILYNNEPINALFHSNSGGKTELAINVWGGELPYLKTVETSGEENYSSYNSETILSKDEFTKIMLEKYSSFKINFENLDDFKIIEFTESGRVQKVKIGNVELSGIDVRKIFSLKSTNFEMKIEGDNIKFSVIGYGHGVGLSQCGSDALAKNGMNYKEIINYYYNDVEICE